jgi:hypothetical protein
MVLGGLGGSAAVEPVRLVQGLVSGGFESPRFRGSERLVFRPSTKTSPFSGKRALGAGGFRPILESPLSPPNDDLSSRSKMHRTP